MWTDGRRNWTVLAPVRRLDVRVVADLHAGHVIHRHTPSRLIHAHSSLRVRPVCRAPAPPGRGTCRTINEPSRGARHRTPRTSMSTHPTVGGREGPWHVTRCTWERRWSLRPLAPGARMQAASAPRGHLRGAWRIRPSLRLLVGRDDRAVTAKGARDRVARGGARAVGALVCVQQVMDVGGGRVVVGWINMSVDTHVL